MRNKIPILRDNKKYFLQFYLSYLYKQNTNAILIYRFTLIFSGLSSIYASIFAPIYFLKFIIEKNYKIYLCKDFFLRKNNFYKNYKHAELFFSLKNKYDKNDLFSSDFFDRVKK